MKTILYATDYSKYSKSELQYVYKLSQQLECALVVLHIFDTPFFSKNLVHRPVEQVDKYAYEEQLAALNKFCMNNLSNELDKINVRSEVLKNISITDGILIKAKELKADIVVVGMKNDDSKRGLLAGNIANNLIKKSPAPILIIPNDIKPQKIKKIVYATDYEEEDIYAIKELARIAEAYKAKIYVVHISTQGEYAVKDQMEWFKEMLFQKVDYSDIEFEILFSEYIAERLDAYLDKVNANLIGMLERKKTSLLKQIFHKDLVKKMEAHLKIPLLSFNEENL